MQLPEKLREIQLNGTPYTIYSVTGKVLDTSTRAETEVTGSGGGGYTHRGSGYNSQVNIKSKTTRYTKIFLLDDTGKEHVIDLVDFDVHCRTGSVLTMIWAIKAGQKKGPYIAAYNHNTQEMQFDLDTLTQINTPGGTYIMAVVFTAVVAAAIWGAEALFAILFLGGFAAWITAKFVGQARTSSFTESSQIKDIIQNLKNLNTTHFAQLENNPTD
jgi:uncharacterized membrane protein YciS (DUF1049 family)